MATTPKRPKLTNSKKTKVNGYEMVLAFQVILAPFCY